jgi:predicted nucleic acid-binding protein
LAARGGEQRFLRALSGYRKVNLDTNPIVYYFGGGEPYGRLMKALFGLVDRGSLQVVISRIVQMELLVKPIRDRDLDAVGEVIHFTESTPNVRVEDVSQLIVVQAAFVRADSLDVRDKGRDKNRAADGCKCVLCEGTNWIARTDKEAARVLWIATTTVRIGWCRTQPPE